jgi:hypothetical protein
MYYFYDEDMPIYALLIYGKNAREPDAGAAQGGEDVCNQGQRSPTGAAKTLLKIIGCEPRAVVRALKAG